MAERRRGGRRASRTRPAGAPLRGGRRPSLTPSARPAGWPASG